MTWLWVTGVVFVSGLVLFMLGFRLGSAVGFGLGRQQGHEDAGCECGPLATELRLHFADCAVRQHYERECRCALRPGWRRSPWAHDPDCPVRVRWEASRPQPVDVWIGTPYEGCTCDAGPDRVDPGEHLPGCPVYERWKRARGSTTGGGGTI